MAALKSIPASSEDVVNHSPEPLRSAVRREVARVACFEVQALANMLHDYIELNDNCGDIAPSMRAGLIRLSKLSNIIFEAVIAVEHDESDAELVSSLGGRNLLSAEVSHV